MGRYSLGGGAGGDTNATTVTITDNESTAYSELTSSTGYEGRVHHGFGTNGLGGIEMLTDTGTANVLVTCSAMNGYFSTGVIS